MDGSRSIEVVLLVREGEALGLNQAARGATAGTMVPSTSRSRTSRRARTCAAGTGTTRRNSPSSGSVISASSDTVKA